MLLRPALQSSVSRLLFGLTISASLLFTQSLRAADLCPKTPPITAKGRDAALVVDGNSGKTLFEHNAYAIRHPASLTKMMTLYLSFEALKAGKLKLITQVVISRHAAAQKPVNMSLSVGATMPFETAIKAMIVRSANDVAVAIAEALGGTEAHFAELMTAKASSLGMKDTFYHNASGLPDALQVTTAHDLAILAHHLAYDFPLYYPYFATANFSYAGVTYYTHDNLLYRFKGTDGIKTGYTNASGFNLVSSVIRNGAHVIGVVMGGDTAIARDDEMIQILGKTFDQIKQDPTLVSYGPIPWKATPTPIAPSPDLLIAGIPPAPTINLPAPTFTDVLSKSGEIDEDAAETYTSNVPLAPMALDIPRCPPSRKTKISSLLN